MKLKINLIIINENIICDALFEKKKAHYMYS